MCCIFIIVEYPEERVAAFTRVLCGARQLFVTLWPWTLHYRGGSKGMSGSNVNNYMHTCHEESMFESALQMNNDILLLLNDNYSPKDNENNCRY